MFAWRPKSVEESRWSNAVCISAWGRPFATIMALVALNEAKKLSQYSDDEGVSGGLNPTGRRTEDDSSKA